MPDAGVRLVCGLLVLLAACSGPLSDSDDSDDSPTATAVEIAAEEPRTATAHARTPSPVEAGIPVAQTSTQPASRTETAGAGATTSQPVLQAAGTELTIEGRPVSRVVQGDGTGRTIYALVDEREVWRSHDGGQSWFAAGSIDGGELVVAINESNVLYAGDRGSCGRGFSFNDFMRSTNAGREWEVVETNRDIQPLLAYETQRAAYVYGTNCGLHVSTNGADSWQAVADLAGEEIFAAATERSDPLKQILVVGVTEGGTGRLFLLTTEGPAEPQFSRALTQFWGQAAIDWTDGRIVVATAWRVGVSDDEGETWGWSRRGLEQATYSVDPLFDSIPDRELDPYRELTTARIDPTNPDRVWVGGVHGAYLSLDAGQTWSRVGADTPITGIVISSYAERVLISTESGTRIWTLEGK